MHDVIRKVLAAAMVLTVLVTAACGASEPSSNTSSSDDTASTEEETTTTTVDVSTTSTTLEVPPLQDDLPSDYNVEDMPEPEGANAGPNASGSTSFYDSSQQAADNFWAWWTYEVLEPQDAQRSNQDIYLAGIAACATAARGAGTYSTETAITQQFGVSRTGAAGIIKSAFEALCPQYNSGYRSNYDRNVDIMMNAVRPHVIFTPSMPPFYYFGYFISEVCGQMTHMGLEPSQIEVYMSQPSVFNRLALMEAGEIEVETLRIYIKAAVMAHCSGFYTRLPAPIQMSY